MARIILACRGQDPVFGPGRPLPPALATFGAGTGTITYLSRGLFTFSSRVFCSAELLFLSFYA